MDSLRISGLGIYKTSVLLPVFLFFSSTHSLIWTDTVNVALINHCNCTIGNWMAEDVEKVRFTLVINSFTEVQHSKKLFSQEVQVPGIKKVWNYRGCFCPLHASAFFCMLSFEYWSWVGSANPWAFPHKDILFSLRLVIIQANSHSGHSLEHRLKSAIWPLSQSLMFVSDFFLAE